MTESTTGASTDTTDRTLSGQRGTIVVRVWENPAATRVVVLVHGYGEHSGRYAHVAARLVADGAVVYAPDHYGHGRSEGERALIDDAPSMVVDLHQAVRLAVSEHPDLPVVMVGHSMGGILATMYAQAHREELRALVLSAPVIGGNPAMTGLLDLDPIPDVPLDPAGLSRDPAVGEAYASDPLVYHGPFARASLETLLGAGSSIALQPGFGDLPVLYMQGENDPLAPMAVTKPAVDHLAGSDHTERIFPGAMHEIFNETNRDEVIDELAVFVNRVA